MDLRVKLKDNDIIFPIVHIPAEAPPDPSPEIGKGYCLVELERAEEELDKELEERPNAGLMTVVKELKDVKNFANYLVTQKSKSGLWPIGILVGGKMFQIPFDPRRKCMQAKNVEKLKAFFKKHFGKE